MYAAVLGRTKKRRQRLSELVFTLNRHISEWVTSHASGWDNHPAAEHVVRPLHAPDEQGGEP
jgi:hypothetical protein